MYSTQDVGIAVGEVVGEAVGAVGAAVGKVVGDVGAAVGVVVGDVGAKLGARVGPAIHTYAVRCQNTNSLQHFVYRTDTVQGLSATVWPVTGITADGARSLCTPNIIMFLVWKDEPEDRAWLIPQHPKKRWQPESKSGNHPANIEPHALQ